MAKANRGARKLTVTPGLDVAAAPKVFVIDDDTPNSDLFNPVINGEVKGHGLVPRDYAVYPREMFDQPTDLKLIPKSEWSARIKEMDEQKNRVSDILLAQNIPSLDQGQNGYCWGHSTVGCVQAVRAINNQPYVPLSAYMVCAIIKKGANEGGWAGLSAKFLRENGVCSQKLWPQGNRDYRKLDTAECRADAAKHKTSEEWVDLTNDVYDQNMTFETVITCLLSRIPVAGDFGWWSHSVMLCDPVEVEPGSFGYRLRNSWGDGWEDKGFGLIRGSKTKTDSAIGIRVSGATPV